MQSQGENDQLLRLIEEKCENLRISEYECGNRVNHDHYGPRLLGCLIAHYESEIDMKKKVVSQFINSTQTANQPTDLAQNHSEKVQRQENQAQNQSLQVTQKNSVNDMLSMLKKQCEKLKISIDEEEDSFHIEKKPVQAAGALIAYYETELGFLEKSIQRLIENKAQEQEIQLIEQGKVSVQQLYDEQYIKIPSKVWEQVVQMISQRRDFNQEIISELPQNLNITIRMIFQHFQRALEQTQSATQQLTSDLETKIRSLENQLTQFQSDYEHKIQNQQKKDRIQIQQLNQQIKAKQQAFILQITEFQRLKADFKEKEIVRKGLEQQFKQFEEKNIGLLENIIKLEEQNKNLIAEIEQFKTKLDVVQFVEKKQKEILEKKEEQLQNLRKQLDMKTLQRNSIAIKCKESNEKLYHLEAKEKHLNQTLAKIFNQNMQVKAKLKGVEMMDDLKELIKQLKQENMKFKLNLNEKQGDIKKIIQNLQDQKKINQQHLEQSTHLKNDIEKIQLQKELLLGQFEKKKVQHQDEVNQLKNQLLEKSSEIQSINVSKQSLNKQVETLRQQLKDLCEQNMKLNEQKHNLTNLFNQQAQKFRQISLQSEDRRKRVEELQILNFDLLTKLTNEQHSESKVENSECSEQKKDSAGQSGVLSVEKIDLLVSYTNRIKKLTDELQNQKDLFLSQQKSNQITIKSLQNQLQLSKKQIFHLRQNNEIMENKCQQLDKGIEQIKILSEKALSFQNKNHEIMKQLQERTKAQHLVENQLAQIQPELENLREEHIKTQELIKQFQALKIQNEQDSKKLKQAMQNLKKQDIAYQYCQDKRKKQKKQFQGQITHLTETQKKLQLQFNEKNKNLESQLEKQRKSLSEKEKIIEKAKILHVATQKLLQIYRKNIDQQVQYTGNLSQNVSQLKEKTLKKQAEYKQHQQKIKKVRSELEEEVRRVEGIFNEQKKEVEQQKINQESIQKHVEQDQELFSFYQRKFLQFWKKSEEQEKLLKIAEEERKQLEKLKNENSKMAQSINKLQQQNVELKNRTENYEESLKKLSQISLIIEQLDKKINQQKQKLQTTQAQLEEHKRLLKEKEQEIQEINKEYISLLTNTRELTDQKSEIEKKIPLLEQQCRYLHQKNEQLKQSDKQRSTKERQRLERELLNSKQQYEKKLQEENLKIRRKIDEEKKKQDQQMQRWKLYLIRMQKLIKKFLEQCKEKIELKEDSIDEWIATVEQLVLGNKVKYNSDYLTKAIKRSEKISNRLASMAD